MGALRGSLWAGGRGLLGVLWVGVVLARCCRCTLFPLPSLSSPQPSRPTLLPAHRFCCPLLSHSFHTSICFPRVQERRVFDERFIRRDSTQLCDLTSAADALEMRALVDLGGKGGRQAGWVAWVVGGVGW